MESLPKSAGSPGQFDAALGDQFTSSGAVGAFLWAVWAYLSEFVKQGIDTPEERQRVKAAVMASFDAYVAPRLGTQLAAAVRKSLDSLVSNMLETFGS